MTAYEYEPGFCRLLHYNGLWRVEYEGVARQFRKVRMACSCMKDGCEQECDVFREIPEIKEQDMGWHMKDKNGNLIG